jgi:hypothetical protein
MRSSSRREGVERARDRSSFDDDARDVIPDSLRSEFAGLNLPRAEAHARGDFVDLRRHESQQLRMTLL